MFGFPEALETVAQSHIQSKYQGLDVSMEITPVWS